MLAYPFAVMSTGTLGGTLLCAGIIAPLAATGVTVLMSSMRRCGATVAVRSYGDVVRVAFGARLANAVDALIVVYSFGTCIGYLILLADVATPFVMLGIGPGNTKPRFPSKMRSRDAEPRCEADAETKQMLARHAGCERSAAALRPSEPLPPESRAR